MFETKSFSFTADCKSLEQSIKSVLASTGPTALFFAAIYKKSVCVIGNSGDFFALVSVPNTTTESTNGIFCFDPVVLPGLIRNRAIMDFKFTGSECTFAQVKGKYSGKIPTPAATEDQLEQLSSRLSEKSSSTSITAEAWSAIKKGVFATSVKDVYQNTTLLSYVVLAKGKLTVSSFDSQHFGLYRTVVGDDSAIKVALPQTHFALIEGISKGADTKFSITPQRIKATGPGFILVLPATQAEDKHFTMVVDFRNSLKAPVYECECSLDKLASIADNLHTLYTANSNFVVKTKGEAFSVGLSTSSGSGSDAIRVKATGKDTSLSVDPRLFMDIVSIAKPLKSATVQITDKVLALTSKVDKVEVFIACSRVE